MAHSLIDSALVEQRISRLAQHGAYGEAGVWRTVYSPEWVAAMDLYAQWCREAGLTVARDAVGNVWGRLQGSESGPAIVSGSHIDTQRPGGRYDGALGAIAALTAIEALAARYAQPRRTLEAVALCEEEGSRFPTANFWGSRAITGAIASTDADRTVGYDGETIANAMHAVGLAPERIDEAARHDIESFIELHIEQGPVLEHADLPIAVVTGITGLRHYDVDLTGVANHAGAFPMDLRQDPMVGFAEIVTTLTSRAERIGRPAVTTIGRAFVEPNGASIIPEKIRFTVDARHPELAAYRSLCAAHEQSMREIAQRRGLEIDFWITADHQPCPSDGALVEAIEAAAGRLGVPCHRMASGAGHDSQQIARIAKIAMIFVRSKDGRSHMPKEFSSIPDIVAGISVLAETLLALAY